MKFEAAKTRFTRHPWRTGAVATAFVALAYFIYLCLPHGYASLEQLELRLDSLTQQGTHLEDIRAGLSHEGITYHEWVQTSPRDLLTVGQDVKIRATSGERVLYSRLPTEAWHFPCAEELDVIFVFDANNILQRRYIGRFHLCP